MGEKFDSGGLSQDAGHAGPALPATMNATDNPDAYTMGSVDTDEGPIWLLIGPGGGKDAQWAEWSFKSRLWFDAATGEPMPDGWGAGLEPPDHRITLGG